MKFGIYQRVFTLFLFLVIHTTLKSQSDTLYYLYSDFETPEDQAEWTNFPNDDPNITWQFDDEGGKNGNYPLSAATGTHNALFSESDVDTVYSRYLISPKIDLSVAVKPQLAFQHAQYSSSFFGQDSLRLLFRTSDAAPWDLIQSWQIPVNGWAEETYNIEDIDPKYLCEDFQFAFLAYSINEKGVCVDSVAIEETEIIQKYVNKITYSEPDNNLIASKGIQVPLIKVRIDVLGNDGLSNLNNIAFVLKEGQSSYFKTNGFRLFYTVDDLFQNEYGGSSTQIGTAVSMSSNAVSFTGLGKKLKLGKNYIWLTADFADNIPHNSEYVFGVNANSMKFNDSLMPGSAVDTAVNGIIEEAVFYDNFETNKGWDITSWGGDFEIGVPLGKSFGPSKDPDYTYSGTNVLGTDLSDDGRYLASITSATAYHAESPELNLQYYDRVKLSFRSYSGIVYDDSATVSVSNDGGTTWHRIWYNSKDNPTFIPVWKEFYFEDEADNYMSRQPSVKLRFSIGKSGTAPQVGFNIDQLIITGNHLETDVGITDILSPYDDCIGFNNDTVKIVVKNYAEAASPSIIPVYYALWGTDSTSTIVKDTIRTSIPKDGSLVFKFSQLANFPRGDIYDNFTVGIDLESDEDDRNDIFTKTFYIQDTETPPLVNDFEYKGGVWIPSKDTSWMCLTPDGSDIQILPESPNSWILSNYGEYPINDVAYLTSSCYDLTNATRNIIELKYWNQSEEGHDGMAVEYTTDDGATWHLVDTTVYGRKWGWYTEQVSALGHIGWSGTTGDWITAKELLPASLSTEPKVKFRIKWMSDGNATTARGPAIDDFEIYSAPADVGVSSISSPIDACELQNASTTSVYVKNYGFNTMPAGDSIIVGVDFESEPPVIDTFTLASDLLPGDSVEFTVGTNFDITTAGSYDIMAYTLIEEDPFLYQTNNDTAWKTFNVWPNPTVILADTIGSRDPDTVKIKPQYPDWVPGYSYLWEPGSVSDSIYDVSLYGFGPQIYNLTVTEPTHGCETKDSVNVLLLYFDAGADSIINPQSFCQHDPDELVTVRVRNTGTDSLLYGDQIQVHYRVNGGTIHKDTITLSSTLYANQTIDYTFVNEPYDFSAIGTYSIDAWAHFGSGDTTKTNDSTFAVIKTYGYTPLNLGPDLTIQDTSYTLDAGSGFESYLWSNGDTTQTTYINTSGTYWVEATDPNSCPAYDTINIWFKIRDIMASALFAPVTDCEGDDASAVQFTIKNNGTDTIKTTDNLTYSYSLNGGARVTQNAAPASNILPGGQYTYLFSGTVDVSAYKDYNFDLTVTSAGDMNTSNDTLNITVSTYPNPVVDFGDDRVVTGLQELLNADAGPGHIYLWQDNVTATPTFTAISSGEYSCTVTNITTGCWASDTVVLTFDYADYSINSITINNNPCQGQPTAAQLEIEYVQGSNARISTTLYLAYQAGTDDVVTEEITVDELWSPGGTKYVSLTKKPVFNQYGTVPLKVYFDGMNDLNSANDEYTKNIDVQAMPVIDFGGDTLGVELPYQLDPGNFTSYQWQDNSTNRYFTATIYGQYSVTVTNAANCPATKTVYLEEPSSFYNAQAEKDLDVNLYPNPATSVLNIEAKIRTNKEITIELLDISNRVVFAEKHKGVGTYTNELDISSVVPGIYFLRIRNAEIYYINKIVVQ